MEPPGGTSTDWGSLLGFRRKFEVEESGTSNMETCLLGLLLGHSHAVRLGKWIQLAELPHGVMKRVTNKWGCSTLAGYKALDK